MTLFRTVIGAILSSISDDELKSEIVDYLSRRDQEKLENNEIELEDLQERQRAIREDIEETERNILDSFERRGRRYNYLGLIFLFAIIGNWCMGMNYLQIIGVTISLIGSCILALGLINGIYWIFGILVALGYGSPRRYFKKSLLNDTVDGFYGVTFLILGFIVQLTSLL